MTFNPNPGPLVVAAAQAVADKHAAFEAAKVAYLAAESAVKLAEHRAEHAIHTDDAAGLVEAVETADRGLRTAKVTVTVAASILAAAKQHHAKVTHDSLQGDYDAARAARLAAATKADAGRAMIAEAESDWHAATAKLNTCYASGRVREFDGQHLALRRELGVQDVMSVPTASLEAELWAALAANTGV